MNGGLRSDGQHLEGARRIREAIERPGGHAAGGKGEVVDELAHIVEIALDAADHGLIQGFARDEQWQHTMLEKIPLRRFGRLDDVGGAAVFLCSDAAAYITGQIIYIDGGYLAAL